MDSHLSHINIQAKSVLRNIFVGSSTGLTTKIFLLNTLTSLRSLGVFTVKEGLLQFSDPGENKKLATGRIPPKTLVQNLSRKVRGVEVGVVLCFISDAGKMLVCSIIDNWGNCAIANWI